MRRCRSASRCRLGGVAAASPSASSNRSDACGLGELSERVAAQVGHEAFGSGPGSVRVATRARSTTERVVATVVVEVVRREAAASDCAELIDAAVDRRDGTTLERGGAGADRADAHGAHRALLLIQRSGRASISRPATAMSPGRDPDVRARGRYALAPCGSARSGRSSSARRLARQLDKATPRRAGAPRDLERHRRLRARRTAHGAFAACQTKGRCGRRCRRDGLMRESTVVSPSSPARGSGSRSTRSPAAPGSASTSMRSPPRPRRGRCRAIAQTVWTSDRATLWLGFDVLAHIP